jgi:flagellar protein FliO/FliZ
MCILKRTASTFSLSALFCFTLFPIWTGVSFAAEDPGSNLPGTDFSQMGAFDSLQMIGKVIFFLLVIIGLFYVLVRFLAKKNHFSMFGSSVRSIGGIPLGQNKSIQIVEIGHSLFVVGVGENIQLLDKIDDADEVAYITDLFTSTQRDAGFPTIGKWLSKLQSNKKEAVEEEVEITSSFQQVFHDKLQQVTSRNKNVEEWLTDQKQIDRLNDK